MTGSSGRRSATGAVLAMVTVLTVVAALIGPISIGTAAVGPAFSKVFGPDTIGPGSTTTLTFTIDNSAGAVGATDMAFTDALPSAVTVADPAGITNSCLGTADWFEGEGFDEITFTGGAVGPSETCTISINVTSSAVGIHTNTSSDLTSSLGVSPPATDDLTVDATLPGFFKSFAPSSIPPGGTSTLTFVVDNTANAGDVGSLQFTDALPAGLVVAAPSNKATTCSGPFGSSLTAAPGTGSISLVASGFLPGFPALTAGSSCTVTVDVTSPVGGTFDNVSGQLFTGPGVSVDTPAGFATASLDVPVEFLTKAFVDDPVAPGGEVTLEFTIQNPSRDFPATGIAFTDDLDPLGGLTGLVATDTPKSVCGGTLSGTDVLSLIGGNLPAEGSCTFSVTLLVPAGAAPDTYPNTTSAITATIDGESVVDNTASDELVVSLAPTFTKEYLTNPVGAGGTTTLQFTIVNNNPDAALTDIAFEDVFDDVTPTASVVPTNPVCGGSAFFTPFIDGEGFNTPAQLTFTDGSVPAGGSCTIELTLDVVTNAPSGTYPNTTSPITGITDTCNDECFDEVEGLAATDVLEVAGGPSLTKEFTDDPAGPSGTVTLEFTLTHPTPAPDPGDPVVSPITSIAFSDDLDAALTGLVATGLPVTACGGTAGTSDGGQTIDFTGGSLVAGEVCAFSVVLDVPPVAAPGAHRNTTSIVIGVVDTLAVTGNPASDDLEISSLTLTKEFTDDPVLPGGTVTLDFTITNSSTADATAISFSDDLDAVLPGLVATAGQLPLTEACDPDGAGGAPGAGTVIGSSGDSVITFFGGALASGESCTVSVSLDVPSGAATDSYPNTTSSFVADFGSGPVSLRNASDELIVEVPLPPLVTKSFTNDPVAPGDEVTLSFIIANPNEFETLIELTDIAFVDSLDAIITGLAPRAGEVPLTDPCGTGSSLAFAAGSLALTGGNLEADTSCEFAVVLDVPSGALPATYVNETSAPTADAGGFPVTGEPATDLLDVVSEVLDLTLTKEFTDDPVFAGDPATLRFTLTNGSASPLADLAFNDNIEAVLSGLSPSDLPQSGVCGPESAVSFAAPFIRLTNASLAAAGSCTFEVTLVVPASALGGDYPNVTSQVFRAGSSVAGVATDTLVVTAEADISVTKTDGVTAAVPGQDTVTYTIVVTNAGPSTDPAVLVTDLFPTDGSDPGDPPPDPRATTTCTYTSVASGGATGNTAAGSGEISDNLFMPAGSSVAYTADCAIDPGATGTLSNTVGAEGVAFDPDLDNNSATDDDTVLTPEADISVTKTDGVTSAVPGQDTVIYTVVVSNDGPSNDPSVAVADTFPGGLSCAWTSVAAGGATGNVDGSGAALANTLWMPVGASVTYTVSCTIDPATTGTLSNTATATGSFDPVPSNDSATDDDTALDPEADLAISKTDSPDPVLAGETLTYTITVDNAGPSDAQNVVVVDTLPSGVSYVSDTSSGGCVEAPAGTLTCDLGSLATTGSRTFDITVAVDPGQPDGVITNTASVTSDATDPVGSNDSDDEDTTVATEADLSISKTDSSDPATTGQTLTYTVTVDNAGPSDAQNVVVTESLPTGVTLVSTSGCSEDPTGVPSCFLGTVAAGGSASYTVTVDVDQPAGVITNTATVSSDTADPVAANDSIEEDTTVAAQADISVTTLSAPLQVGFGETVKFSFLVGNSGPSDATGVVVTNLVSLDGVIVATAGCSEDPLGAPLCSLGTISAGDSKAFTFTVAVASDAAAKELTTTVSAASDAADPDLANNSVATASTIRAAAEVGLFNPTNARWSLRMRDGSIRIFTYGNPGDLGVMGDWDGDGHRTPGVFRPSTLTFYGRNSNSSGPADFTFKVGVLGDVPISGDWNGNDMESLALYRPSTQQFFVYDDFANVAVDHALTFGDPGDVPFAGDIDNDGDDDIAVQRPDGGLAGRVFFRTALTTGVADVIFTYGDPFDRPFFGDWNHDDVPTIGLYRPDSGTPGFYLRNSNSAGVADVVVPFGDGVETPVAGPFSGMVRPKSTPWQNSPNPFDVNDDGFVTPTDVLLLFSGFEQAGPRILPNPPVAPDAPPPFYDVDGDGRLGVRDALLLIDEINSS